MSIKILFPIAILIQLVITDDYQGRDAYIGCFVDSRLARDLNKLPGQIGNVWVGSNANMSVNACLNLCRGFSLPYAGLEFGNECYCGDTYGKYGQVSDEECNYYCNGNSNDICGGLSRLSVYSVRIMIKSELVAVLNLTQFNYSPIRIAQAPSFLYPDQFSWIEYSKESGEIKIYIHMDTNTSTSSPSIIRLNSIRPDLPKNRAYVFLSLRGNQLAAFYNCYISDALIINDPKSVDTITKTFFSASSEPVSGQIIFNRNLNEVFRSYGCMNTRRYDAYEQIFSQVSHFARDYCQLTLNDIQRVNVKMSSLIEYILSEKKTTEANINLVKKKLENCWKKSP